MASESDDSELFDDSGVGTSTINLMAELRAVQDFNTETGSLNVIPPTPKKHRKSRDWSDNVLRRLAFAPAVDRPPLTEADRSKPTRTPTMSNRTAGGRSTVLPVPGGLSNPVASGRSTPTPPGERQLLPGAGSSRMPAGERVPVALYTSTPRASSKRSTNTTAGLPCWSEDLEHTRSRSTGDEHLLEILSEVKKTNVKLTEYGVRLETLEQRMCNIEQKGCETPTCSSSCSDTVKAKVPPAVRHLIRDVYKTLDQSEDFVGFDLKKRFTEAENQAVLRRVITETKALDETVAMSQIRAAVRRFFQSKQEDLALRENGKYAIKVQNQRRRNRVLKVSVIHVKATSISLGRLFAQKLEARKAALAHTNALTEEKKKTWREILVPAFMSSEERCEEDGRPVLFVKSLPWQAPKVSKFLKQMDLKGEKKRSKRSILQTMPRLPGSVSARLTPTTFEPTFWGFSVDNEENMDD